MLRQRQDHGCADGDLNRSVLREGMRYLRKETKVLSDELFASWNGRSTQYLFRSELVETTDYF